jgi:integrase
VTVYARGQVWYLRYYESGQRRQVRASADRQAARQLAAEVNAQVESGVPASTSYEQIAVDELRRRWLDHHETVLRSSLSTIGRYRTASQHLLNFWRDEARGVRYASGLGPSQAAAFAAYLRSIQVAPNGHAHTPKRRLRDKGVRYVLEVCRSLFNFAIKRRHMPPYAANPFSAIEVERMPIEDAKPIKVFTREQELAFLAGCDAWQRPIFLTLMLTGLRPGELCHLLLPHDLDLDARMLHVRNKPQLGWQVKTRGERAVPLHPALVESLRVMLDGRTTGAVFQQRRCSNSGYVPPLQDRGIGELERMAADRLLGEENRLGRSLDRKERHTIQRTVWRDLAAVDEDDVRRAFIKVCRSVEGISGQTAPKVLRHGFATMLQESNVDPLVRNLLMGHSPGEERSFAGRGFAQSSLGMTAVYTHTSQSTVSHQLQNAIDRHFGRTALSQLANLTLRRRRSTAFGS